jgi:hypothetical protein
MSLVKSQQGRWGDDIFLAGVLKKSSTSHSFGRLSSEFNDLMPI